MQPLGESYSGIPLRLVRHYNAVVSEGGIARAARRRIDRTRAPRPARAREMAQAKPE